MPRIPGARITSSPVFAARLARQTPAISLTPARQLVLLGAARLWCRDLAFPTARLLAGSAGRAPSTVLNGFETMPRIHAEIIRREWAVLGPHQHSPDPADWIPRLIGHVRVLCELDPTMLRLPSLVYSAVRADAQCPDRRPVSPLSLAVNLVAVYAEPAVEVPADGQLQRIILAGLSAIALKAEDGPTSEGRAA